MKSVRSSLAVIVAVCCALIIALPSALIAAESSVNGVSASEASAGQGTTGVLNGGQGAAQQDAAGAQATARGVAQQDAAGAQGVGSQDATGTTGTQLGGQGATSQDAAGAPGVGAQGATSQDAAGAQTTAQGATSQDAADAQTTAQGTVSQEATPIFDANGLLAMASNPNGNYQLMCDVDLAGTAWQPIEFHGTLEGNGHAILNANITTAGQARRSTYDGNMKEYTTAFAGFFDTLENATVRNVVFLGLNVNVNTSEPTFVGGLCGYMDNATIEGCTIGGEVWLATTGTSFGVGGIAGFGRGRIENCVADVTLVCRDLDAAAKDEQFMGGAYGVGYADLVGNTVTLRGYDSDHGYVHNGGLIGMYIVYDESDQHAGTVANNRVQGFITFFEDNEDRRAYCEPEIGENMSMEAITTREGNTSDFTPDERFEYDVDLVPHACENPQWSEEVVAGTCTDRGHTQRTCALCGYTYPCNWTPVAHDVAKWTSAQVGGGALDQGSCARCGAVVFEPAAAHVGQGSVASSEQAAAADVEVNDATAVVSAGINPLFVVIPVVLGVVLIAVAIVAVVRTR
ncbi:MAG: hypothetical protein IKG21_07685 [Atopobiaceae bacterium]|nr:hypothetical protein [Atopobiaceae bacterium]